MTAKRLGKKILKITGIILGILIVLLICFHFWFKAHAKGLIEDLVESQSHGKLKLKIGKFHFSYFSRKIELDNAVFYNTDTLNGTTAYHFRVKKMKLKAKAILPIVFKKQILIESITLLNPHIEVTRLRAGDTTGKKEKKDVSIPEEMGKVYYSIQDALQVLQVKLFQIDNGTFTLINKITPGQLPMNITNINFHIDNLQVGTGRLTGKEKLLFSDNIVLRCNDQNIIFPDGRHRLSFRRFRINIRKKLVEFDSCTISATRTDSSASSFNVFFDALFLTNIDFDTLYRSEVIKADSVYCLSPKFNLTVEVAGKKKGDNKPSQKLEKIIEQLTGNLQLGYVVVSNADFNINTIKNSVPSSFTFSNNNFEMSGLSVDQDAPKPLKVKSFAMAIRNYENFIKDSSYSINFDSVLFKDDHITLSNFIFNNLDHGKILNTFSIPQFNLLGLSWEDLVFERKLKADQAIMFNPRISYTAPARPGRQNIFQSLEAVNKYIDLQQLDIRDGTIDLKLKNDLSVQLDNATLSIKSHSLLESKKMAGIKNSLTQLRFDKGTIHAGNLDLELDNILYIGQSGQFGAGSINVRNAKKTVAIALQGVSVGKMKVDEVSGNVYAENVKWQEGDVKINAPGKTQGTGKSTIELRNVQGLNTLISGIFDGKSVSTKINSISFNELNKQADSKLIIEGLAVNGTQLKVKGNSLDLSVADYDITDGKSSSLQQIVYKTNNGKTDAAVSIPSLTLIPHVQPLLNGDIALDAINMIKPVIDLHLTSKITGTEKTKPGLPKIDISELKLSQPKISFTRASDSGMLALEWHGERNGSNFLQATDLHTDAGGTLPGYRISDLNFNLTDFVFTNPKGKAFNTGDGKVAAQIKNIKLEQPANQPIAWKANVSNFDARDFRLDSLGKSKGNLVMSSGSLHNLNIGSTTIADMQKLASANTAFQLQQLTGYYSDANTNLHWFNAGFNRGRNIFSMDSFSMTPVLSKDSFNAKQSYQTDYITLKSGAIRIGPVDIDTYIKDKTLNIGIAAIDRFLFTDFKDRQLPFNAGIIKPLPVNLVKKIPQKLSIDTVELTSANVEYTEINEKTKDAGTIPVTRMSVRLLSVKNYNIGPTDSLRIQATGYLMDTAWIRLRVKESYTDTLGGFLMTVRIKPADLSILNPVLMPLASVKLESGYLDTLSLRAVGREYLSLGEMKMFYHDLKIRFLKNGNETKKTFLTGLITFLANSFVIRNKNTSRIGNIFFIRNRERSVINYLIKITMSGVASSVGAKSNRKMMRKYRKELRQRNLPPIDLD